MFIQYVHPICSSNMFMDIQYIRENVVPDTLSRRANLVASIEVDSDLLSRICTA